MVQSSGADMLAYVISDGDGAVNGLLAAVADNLRGMGVAVGGVVQINTERETGRACHMDLSLLSRDGTVRISQDLGAGATGCRLDPDGLERAVGLVSADLARTQLIIVNRFGKQEADGRGFRPVIGEALAQGIPVILALRPDFLPAFAAFTEGLGVALPADATALTDWAAAQLV